MQNRNITLKVKNNKKESHTGRKSTQRENQRVAADVQRRKHGGYSKSVQGNHS